MCIRDRDVSLLRSLGIDEELFPPISQSLEISGYLQPGPAHELGLSPGIPVVTGCGDAQASAVGIGIAGPDQLLAVSYTHLTMLKAPSYVLSGILSIFPTKPT